MQQKPWRFCILTFGCKVNQYESQSIREAWLLFKGEEVKDINNAHVVLVNTCGVTANAIADVRQIINKLEKLSAKVIITGCATKIIKEQIPTTKQYLFIAQKHKEQLIFNKPYDITSTNKFQKTSLKKFPSFSIKKFYRSRPTVKIQDGCSSCCTYCIIPTIRGGPSSRNPNKCLEEVRMLLNTGYREIILSGINLHQYHKPEEGCNTFWDLVLFINQALAPEWGKIARIRISSLDPAQFTQHSYEVIANSSMLCPQLHLSIQSGSTDVLKTMRRTHYTPEHILNITQNLSTIWPIFGLGADIITGFPGETEIHLKETVDIINELPLSYAHVFPFSPRPGTIALKLQGQIKISERQRRAKIIRNIILKKQKLFYQKLLKLPILHVAPEGNNYTTGLDQYYTSCCFSEPLTKPNLSIIPVTPLSITPKGLLVKAIESP